MSETATGRCRMPFDPEEFRTKMQLENTLFRAETELENSLVYALANKAREMDEEKAREQLKQYLPDGQDPKQYQPTRERPISTPVAPPMRISIKIFSEREEATVRPGFSNGSLQGERWITSTVLATGNMKISGISITVRLPWPSVFPRGRPCAVPGWCKSSLICIGRSKKGILKMQKSMLQNMASIFWGVLPMETSRRIRR